MKSLLQKVGFYLLRESELKKARRLRKNGHFEDSYRIYHAAFQSNPDEALSEEISSFLGTSSRFGDVLSAMQDYFDLEFYLAYNPDVNDAKVDGRIHYLLFGWKEGRNPSMFFDHAFYTKQSLTLSNSDFPLAHYWLEKDSNIPTNPISQKVWFIPESPVDDELFSSQPAMKNSKTQCVVIIPVYKGYDETISCIYHALKSRGEEQYSVLVINDQSPDRKLSEKLTALASHGLFDYFENSVNKGFVRTVNYALKELTDNLDVILLNSDAYVFPGWFGRMTRHANDSSVATITPFSNNATICSYPATNRDNNLCIEITPIELDKLASQVNQGVSVEVPTGVGFCFFIRRAVINEIGFLDADAFKVGYGEENDFCMRARNAGFKNILATDVFVYHTGSVSFTNTKHSYLIQGQEALRLKHPIYSQLVRNHIATDPALPMRRTIDSARLVRSKSRCVLIVTHKWSGGIETYLGQLRRKFETDGKECIILRVHDLHLVSVETSAGAGLFLPNLEQIDLRIHWQFLSALLQKLSPNIVHVNSLAGLAWEWHRRFLRLLPELTDDLVFVGHDYSPISHHYQLIRPDGIYVGVPDLQMKKSWTMMTDISAGPDICNPEERAAAYSDFFSKVSSLEVPSKAARLIYQQEFPSSQIKVIPHEDHLPEMAIASRRPRDGKLRIAIVGAIGQHKGSDVIAGLAAEALNRQLPLEFYIVGYSNDDSYLRSLGVHITGQYAREVQAIDHLEKIKPDLFFVPSIWPETFCYTLSIALKMKIPPVVFDVGAQFERVSNINWGWVIPLETAASPSQLSEAILAIPFAALWLKRELEK